MGSAVGTLAERTTRCVLLLHLPGQLGVTPGGQAIITRAAGLAWPIIWD